jgi:chemotaxis protein methyltransferase CheR
VTAVEQLFGLIESWTGMCLTRGGAAVSLQRFAAARVKQLGLSSIDEYVKQLAGPLRLEREVLVNAVTVNYTWFYRDAEQLDALGQLLRDGWPQGASLNVWVPGCATGEDAYAVALLAEAVNRPARVLGTDLNSASLAWAREGRYGAWSTRELPQALRQGFTAAGNKALQVRDDVRRRVQFEVHNLVDAPKRPPGAGWDVVLCRNVLIYFSSEGAQAAHERLGAAVAPAGWLVLGASESVFSVPAGMQPARLAGRAALYRPPARSSSPKADAPARVETPQPKKRDAAGSPSPTAGAPTRPAAEKSAMLGGPAAPFSTRGGAAARRAPSAVELTLEGAGLMSTNLAGGIALLMQAREADPLSVEAHLHLGIAFHLSGDAVSAAPALRSALLLDPTLWPASFYLALTYENLGQPAEARREYQRVVDQSQSPLVLEARGVLGDLEAWKADVLALARRRGA